MFLSLLGIILIIIFVSIRQINQYERGILFRFGKFAKILKPGWHIILPRSNYKR